jgi:23S rRNA pseudouridine955/2504/2580 synthase
VTAALVKLTNAQGERFVRVATDADGEHAQACRTMFRVKERFVADGLHFTLVEAKLLTGRTHQIRVHLQHLGLPIMGDPKYGDFALNKRLARVAGLTPATHLSEASPKFDRMFLHAARLGLNHPVTALPLLLEAPLPATCEALLRYLRNATK